ncbi:MAG: hypothetical protein ACR2KJ_14350 [Jatrophihabitans sp.]
MTGMDRSALAVLAAAAHRSTDRRAIGAAPMLDAALAAELTTNRMKVMTPIGSITMLSMYEALARERMREAEHSAAQRRLSARLNSERLWQRLARLAARGEARARRRADEARESYTLTA